MIHLFKMDVVHDLRCHPFTMDAIFLSFARETCGRVDNLLHEKKGTVSKLKIGFLYIFYMKLY